MGLVLLAALVGASYLYLQGPRQRLYGVYSTCPRPSFSHTAIRLSASGATLDAFYDAGPIVSHLSGSYRVLGESVQLTFDSGKITTGRSMQKEQAVSKDQPYQITLEVRSLGDRTVLGPATAWTGATELPVPIFLIHAARLGENPPKTLECPSEVDAWQDESLSGPAA